MRTLHEITELRQALGEARRQAQRIALVPTMGNLHAGHLALVEAARAQAELVVATVFINPLQFGPGEDLDAYPRTLAEDQAGLEDAGCDLLFAPSAAALYPRGLETLTSISVPGASGGLCGASRPGHFDGVATVVTLLFNLVQPDIVCFGEKDYQQLAVIRQLVADLHFPIQIVGVPIVRAKDGLALSSRNGYLDSEQRAKAPELYRTLQALKISLENAEPLQPAIDVALKQLDERGFAPDYLEVRRAEDLGPLLDNSRKVVILAAAKLGSTRLIDNLTVSLPR